MLFSVVGGAHYSDQVWEEPAYVQQLEATAGVKLVVTDRNDPESVGFQQKRTEL